jgi:hypothetical protein
MKTRGSESEVEESEAGGGMSPAVALFDTGAEISAVDQRFVDAHRRQFTPFQSRLEATAAGGGNFTSKLYRIRQTSFGDGPVVKGLYALALALGVGSHGTNKS